MEIALIIAIVAIILLIAVAGSIRCSWSRTLAPATLETIARVTRAWRQLAGR